MSPDPSPKAAFDVAVLGSGPAGHIAALLFASRGYSTALIGPDINPTDGRTTALLDASVTLLKTIGLWEAIAPDAAAMRVMRIVDGTRRLVRAPEVEFDAGEIGLDAFGYNIENGPLVTGLAAEAEAASGLSRIVGTATAITPGATGVELAMGDGDAVRCTLLVGADGRRSPSRAAAGIDVRSWRYDQAALVCNFHHDVPHRDASTEFHTETGPFTLVPLPGNRSSLVCVERPGEAARLAALDETAFTAEIEKRAHFLLGSMRLDGPRQVWPLSSMVAEEFGKDRIALAGEAAHVFPPIGAQGLNLSIRDAAKLEELTARARDRGEDIGGASVLAAYDRARRPDVWTRTAGVDMLNRALLAEFLPVQTLRGFGLYLAGSFGPLRRFMMREGVAPRLGLPQIMRGLGA